MGTYTKEQLTTQLERIQTAAASTRTAIINRGINFCPADAKLADLAYYAKFLCDFPDIRLDYIENGPADGANRKAVYFDTGFVPDTSTRVEIKYYISQTSSEQVVFGCNGSGYYFFESPGSSTVGYKFTGGNSALSVNTVATTGTHVVTTYRDNLAPKMIIDGTTHTGVDTLLNTISYPIYLFARNASGSAANQCLGETRIYYVKIWEDNNLVRFYVPVLHYYNGQYTPCFYDKVNDNYIYNKSVGTVTYSRSEDIMLDYIGNGADTLTGRYYTDYDTGLSINSSIQLYVGGSTTAIADGENRLCATRGNSSNYKIGFFVPYNTSNIRFIFGYQITINGPSAASIKPGARYNMGGYYNSSSNKTFFYFNNAVYTATRTPDLSGFNGYTFKFFDGGAFAGNKIYYSLISYDNIPAGTYIPVLHNDTPAFYNMTDGTYIYNTGQEGNIPSYQILN